jgi:hypothetical protein
MYVVYLGRKWKDLNTSPQGSSHQSLNHKFFYVTKLPTTKLEIIHKYNLSRKAYEP